MEETKQEQEEEILIKKEETKVIQNSDFLYAKPFPMVEHVEPQPINDYEKDMLKGTKTAEELIKEEKNEKPIELTEEEKEKIKRKEYITRVKVISLSRMGKHPLANGSLLSQTDKKKLIETMEKVLLLTDGQIEREFNDVCIEKIFDPKCDYSTYPIYDYKAMIVHDRKQAETM
jgi:hypothetical protein